MDRGTMLRAAGGSGAAAGTARNGMEYVAWGDGPRTLLFIQGGPGSSVPQGRVGLELAKLMFKPYVSAGYTLHLPTRRRHMPAGYTVADMAEDHAQLIDEILGGRADLVVGESYGGMIAQYLAALHPQCLGHLALVATGSRLSSWSDEIDVRLIEALEAGDEHRAARVSGEYLLPGRHLALLRVLLAPVLARRMVPMDDVLTETRADLAYDARPLLSRIEVPVLLVCGDRDRFFTREIVDETAALIPRCTLTWMKGKGHVATASSRHLPQHVLAFVAGS